QHRLGDRCCAQPHARIVSPRRHDLDRPAVDVDGTARNLDARGWFQRKTDQNVLPARNAAEYPAGRVLHEPFRSDLVAVLAAALAHGREAVADLDALDGVDAHHRVRDRRIELVEHRFPEPRRHARRNHVHAGPDRIAVAAKLDHERLERLDLRGIRTEERVVVDGVEIDRLELDRAERGEIPPDRDPGPLAEVLTRDRAGRDPHCRLARGRAPAAAIIAEAVFLVVRVIRVARPETVLDLVVVARALVDVLDQEAARGAGRHALEDPGQDLYGIGLAALRDEARLPRPPAVELLLDVVLRELEPRRTSVDDAAERGPVALAEGRDGEDLPEAIASHASQSSRVDSPKCSASCSAVTTNTPSPPRSSSSHVSGRRG